MFNINWVTPFRVYTEEWDKNRIGKFTSSRISSLMPKQGEELSYGAETYIFQKVGEYITGKVVTEPEPEDDNKIWGLEYEPEAVQKFSKLLNVQYIASQVLVMRPDTQFTSTPDGIWVVAGSHLNDDEFNVRTVEVKCPRKYHNFVRYYMAETSQRIKELNPHYYWQVIDQMDNCDSAVGYLAFYHPLFPDEKNMRVIRFNKTELWEDFALLKAKKQNAVERFKEVCSLFQ